MLYWELGSAEDSSSGRWVPVLGLVGRRNRYADSFAAVPGGRTALEHSLPLRQPGTVAMVGRGRGEREGSVTEYGREGM